MALSLENIDSRTRELMLDEFNYDLSKDALYISNRLNTPGKMQYKTILKKALANGNDTEFATELSAGFLNEYEQRHTPSGGLTNAKVPTNANEMLAEGEFNRYYIRALCRRVIEDKCGVLQVYRAKNVHHPRPDSKRKIGELVNPARLLQDLRSNIGVDTALGIPAGPNSGLSVRIVSGANIADADIKRNGFEVGRL